MNRPEVEWKNRAAFAAFAEAIGIATDGILAVHGPTNEEAFVFYSPNVEQEPDRIFLVQLRRGVDGIWFKAAEPREQVGFAEELERQMREALGDGPPGS